MNQPIRALIAFLTLLASMCATSGQGTIQFLNSALSKVKYQPDFGGPVFDAPPGTHIGVFWGTDAGGALAVRGRGSGTLVTPTAVIGTPGIWSGSVVYPIPGTTEGQRVWMKIAGWIGGSANTLEGSGYYGESAVVSVLLGPTAGPGTVVWQSSTGTAADRMKPFVVGVPEPSVWALGLLSLSLLAIRRQKKLTEGTQKLSHNR